METYFSMNVAGVDFDLINMNVHKPVLFQVFTMVDGKRTRFHLVADDSGNLVFTMRDSCPAMLLELQSELSYEIIMKHRREAD